MEKSRPSRDYGAMTVAQLRTELVKMDFQHQELSRFDDRLKGFEYGRRYLWR